MGRWYGPRRAPQRARHRSISVIRKKVFILVWRFGFGAGYRRVRDRLCRRTPAGPPEDESQAAAGVGACAVKPQLVVNGRTRELGEVGGHVTLLEWLRADGLTGCKEGCAEGECGACAVLVARPGGPDRTRGVAVNACLVPAAAFDRQEVVTAEGLGQPGRLHPVQREMADRGGSQCGYCTPGFVCSMAAEYYRPGRQPAVTGAPGRG